MTGRVAVAILILVAVTFIGVRGMFYLKNISLELCAIVDDMSALGKKDNAELQELFENFTREYKKYNMAMTLFADNENIFDIDLAVKKATVLMKNGMSEELLSELSNISGCIMDIYERMRPNLKNIL